jgi:hypothetical protein
VNGKQECIWIPAKSYINVMPVLFFHMPIPDTSLILVGILPSLRDLEIARVLGWYRIPLRTAPKLIDVDYLAFYQTAAFGEAFRWQIQFIAEVYGHELVTRQDLFRDEPEHPRAREEYYKISLGPLQELKEPILAAQWRRITFLYTTGMYLNRAHIIHDLVVQSEEREILWRSLRERALKTGQYHARDLPEFPIDPELLAFLGTLTDLAG